MISPIVGQVTLGIYGLLLAVGGLIGYFKAGSRASMIAGLLSAAAAFGAMGLSVAGNALGPPVGLLLAVVLFVMFGYRYAVKTKKFMPSGMLAIISLLVLGVMILTIEWSGRAAG